MYSKETTTAYRSPLIAETQQKVDEVLNFIVTEETGSRAEQNRWTQGIFDGAGEVASRGLSDLITYSTRAKGLEINNELLDTTFEGLLAIRDQVKAQDPEFNNITNIFEAADRNVIDSFEELIGQIVETQSTHIDDIRALKKYQEPIMKFIRYAVAAESEVMTTVLLRKVASYEWSEVVLGLAEEDSLFSNPELAAALLQVNFGNTSLTAKKERRALTDEEWSLPEKIFAGYGFTSKETRSIVRSTYSLKPEGLTLEKANAARASALSRNLKAISELAKIDPSLPKKAHQICGISHFGRYSPKQIERQLDPGYTPDAIVVTATDDWNGAFDKFGSEIEAVTEKPFFTEVSNNYQLARRFIALKKAGVAVRHIFIGAHGNQDGVDWTHHQRPSGGFDMDVVDNARSLQKLVEHGVILPECRITFVACDTGHEGAIAEMVAKLPGVGTVQAPDFISAGIQLAEGGSGSLEYQQSGSGQSAGRTYNVRN